MLVRCRPETCKEYRTGGGCICAVSGAAVCRQSKGCETCVPGLKQGGWWRWRTVCVLQLAAATCVSQSLMGT